MVKLEVCPSVLLDKLTSSEENMPESGNRHENSKTLVQIDKRLLIFSIQTKRKNRCWGQDLRLLCDEGKKGDNWKSVGGFASRNTFCMILHHLLCFHSTVWILNFSLISRVAGRTSGQISSSGVSVFFHDYPPFTSFVQSCCWIFIWSPSLVLSPGTFDLSPRADQDGATRPLLLHSFPKRPLEMNRFEGLGSGSQRSEVCSWATRGFCALKPIHVWDRDASNDVTGLDYSSRGCAAAWLRTAATFRNLRLYFGRLNFWSSNVSSFLLQTSTNHLSRTNFNSQRAELSCWAAVQF